MSEELKGRVSSVLVCDLCRLGEIQQLHTAGLTLSTPPQRRVLSLLYQDPGGSCTANLVLHLCINHVLQPCLTDTLRYMSTWTYIVTL